MVGREDGDSRQPRMSRRRHTIEHPAQSDGTEPSRQRSSGGREHSTLITTGSDRMADGAHGMVELVTTYGYGYSSSWALNRSFQVFLRIDVFPGCGGRGGNGMNIRVHDIVITLQCVSLTRSAAHLIMSVNGSCRASSVLATSSSSSARLTPSPNPSNVSRPPLPVVSTWGELLVWVDEAWIPSELLPRESSATRFSENEPDSTRKRAVLIMRRGSISSRLFGIGSRGCVSRV